MNLELLNNKIVKRVLIIFTTIVLILIIIFVAFRIIKSNQNPYGEKITIAEVKKQVGNLSRDQIDNIENQLFSLVKSNTDEAGLDQNIATIRPESVNIEKFENGFYDQFIVDLENLQQSYLIQVDWDNDDESGYPIVVSCLTDPSTIIYPDFHCQDGEELFMIDDVPFLGLLDYLPYQGEISNGETFTIETIIKSEEKDGIVNVIINNCGKDEIINETRAAVSSWLTDKGYDPAKYEISIPLIYYNCLLQ